MKRIIICLDGTWNSPNVESEREDHTKIIKPSNPLKLVRAVRAVDRNGTHQVTYYDLGVGAINKHPGRSNRLLHYVDKTLGGLWGAGFEGNIEDAYHFIAVNHHPGDEIFVFGFSRGASQARGLCRFIDWMGGVPSKSDAYWIPKLFERYLDLRGQGDVSECLVQLDRERALRNKKALELTFDRVSVRLLGVWDTVMSLGSRFEAKEQTTGLERSFHTGPSPAKIVQHARHALAIDEQRYDFRPEVWQEPAHESQTLKQRWFPGVHSNVGGGYVRDGLANRALKWMLEEATGAGLDVDEKFLGHYGEFACDTLYDSRSLKYQVIEARLWLRLKFGKQGIRRLVPDGADEDRAGIALDDSVFERLQADPSDPKCRRLEGKPYRPTNLLTYLVTHPQYDGQLPADVLKEVQGRR